MIDDKELSADEKSILTLAPFMEMLVGSEGWSHLNAIGNAQIAMHTETLLQPSQTREQDLGIKGAIMGIRTILNTPEGILATRRAINERTKHMNVAPSERNVSESPDESIGTYEGMSGGDDNVSS